MFNHLNFDSTSDKPMLTVAPMEGLTTVVFRRVHAKYFKAADAYYLPFVTPTIEPKFTARQLRELAPEVNAGLPVIPQLLTRRSEDFIWAARDLAQMGYKEVNLNLGCPAGTVTAKGKGSGFLADPLALSDFFERVFSEDLGINVSVKCRLGFRSPEEFEGLAELFSNYPICRLIVHPRIKTDLYRGDVRLETLDNALKLIRLPLGYNGDIICEDDLKTMSDRYRAAPNGLVELMVGRGLMADPALFRKTAGGPAATANEILAFYRELLQAYAEHFQSLKNALMRMKEYWFYQLCLFEETSPNKSLDKFAKAIYRTKDPEEFARIIEEIAGTFKVLPRARYGWRKPL